jgi:hypothetical protein
MVRHLATRIGINYTQLIDLTSLFDLSVKTWQRDKMSRGVGSSRGGTVVPATRGTLGQVAWPQSCKKGAPAYTD